MTTLRSRTRRFRCTPAWAFALTGMLVGCAATGPVPPDDVLARQTSDLIGRAIQFPENPLIRVQGIEAAAELRLIHLRPAILAALRDESPAVRFAACAALGELGDASSREAIRPLLQDANPSVRLGAYYALERLGEPLYRRPWAAALREDPDPAVRRNAVLLLGLLKDPRVRPLLMRASSEDPDEGVRVQALEGLALLGDAEAIGRCRMYAFGGVDYRQVFATLVLGRVEGDQWLGALRARLTGATHLETRLAAARGLGMHGRAEGYDLALQSLSFNSPRAGVPEDPPANQIMRVRSMAALALGEIGDRRALGPLYALMADPDDPRVQIAAARAILMILARRPAASAPAG